MASLSRAHSSATSVAMRSQKTSNPVQIKYGWSLPLMQPSIKQALQWISLKVCDLIALTVKAGGNSSLKKLPSTNQLILSIHTLSFYLLVLQICLYNFFANTKFMYKLLWECRGGWCWGRNISSLIRTNQLCWAGGSISVAQLDRMSPPFSHARGHWHFLRSTNTAQGVFKNSSLLKFCSKRNLWREGKSKCK